VKTSPPVRTKRALLAAVLCVALLATAGLVARQRLAACASVPLAGEALLPPPAFDDLAPAASGVLLPRGWDAPALGVQVGEFSVRGGNSFQLLGIANSLRTPAVAVRPGQDYCIHAQALADSRVSATRIQAVFHWRDAGGRDVARDATPWQTARQWNGPGDSGGWSVIRGAFVAPPGAAQLAVSFHPSSDDRVYLDQIVIRRGLDATKNQEPRTEDGTLSSAVTVSPWPDGRRAAVSFSFDWETAMGGLVHSRSVGEPLYDADPALRAMRMREGVTTTLAIFRPYHVRATYYANGYNFLLGNRDRRRFMGDPTFAWATRANGWTSDTWATTRWFAPDPYGTGQSDPAWYFGDLLPALAEAGHDVQSHTFSHLYAGLSSVDELRADAREWNAVAAERGIAPARSLAFPWSGSGGMSDAAWQALAEAGITSITRTSDQPQFRLAPADEPVCRAVPGHERILACPDFYLTTTSAPEALDLIDRAVEADGMIDLWAHTEEVVTPEQIAAWTMVVRHAAERRDAGEVWIAPLAEIAERQHAIADIRITKYEQGRPEAGEPVTFQLLNDGETDLSGVTVRLPFAVARVVASSQTEPLAADDAIILDIGRGETVEVTAWRA
jgi:peptidoglycan/xylan/chitin deacetylase (PgdA/CDA1 family)